MYKEICKTDEDGPQKQVPCVFPFRWYGRLHTGCTWISEENNKQWCSTKVDSKGDHVIGAEQWGYCGAHCPLEGYSDTR